MVVHNSESNQEYLLTAHRDVGIRPLISNFQDFLNAHILPLLDAEVAAKCELRLLGLDAQTAEKESIRIQQDAPLHMTMNDVLTAVEKDNYPKETGADFPFNQQFQAIMDKYLTVGQILEVFFGVKGASQDPKFAYIRDAFWFQFQQLQQQAQQMQMAQQQQAQQQQGGGGGPSGPSGGGGGQSAPENSGEEASHEASAQSAQDDNEKASQGTVKEMHGALDQAAAALGKSEGQLTRSQRKVLHQHMATMERFRRDWVADSKDALQEIMRAVVADPDIQGA
jgi:hypothetical protein